VPAAVMDTPPTNQPQHQPVSDPHTPSWEKSYSVWMHLTTLGMSIIPVIPALVMWQLKRQESPFVDDHGKEVVNFQISLTIYGIAATVFTIVTVGFGAIIAWPLLLVYAIVSLIMGAVAAGNSRYFRYPACVRLIK